MYLLAIDQGTTGSTALLMDEKLQWIADASEDFPQHFPQPGWVEHDLNDIWNSVIKTVSQATAKIDVKKITAIGITNQRETLCFWDKKTAQPLARAIVWQDRRTSEQCENLRKKNLEPWFQKKTGLLLDPYFSGTKASWALTHWPALASAHKKGTLAAGTIDSFILAKLTQGQVHATEPSNASRTLSFDLEKKSWNQELCDALGIPLDIWPEVRPSVGRFGTTQGVPGLPDGIPITGILGDQQSALLGQACIREGMAKCTYGTGAFILLNAGQTIPRSQHRMLTTVAWALSETDYTYALEGSAFVAGAAVQWLRDGLGLISSAAEIETLATSVPSSDGVVLVPSFTGMGAPYWDAEARGSLTGLTRGTTKAHLARATLEGIAFQIHDILRAMQKDLGKPISALNVDGGAAANNFLMQFQSDLLNIELRRPKYLETTSLGAIFAAGIGVGLWKGIDEVQKTWQEDRVFRPQMSSTDREIALARWKNALGRTLTRAT